MSRFALLTSLALVVAATAVYGSRGDRQLATAAGGLVAIGLGDHHTCVVSEDGGVQCWGDNLSGQLGDGTENDSLSPVDVCLGGSGLACAGGERLTGVVDVSAGFTHTCAQTNDGRVMCWGSNSSGQLGDGTTDRRANPGFVCASGSGPDCDGGEPLSGVVQIDSGGSFNCALMEDTGIMCWGSNSLGQLGNSAQPLSGTTAGAFFPQEERPVDVCQSPVFTVGVETSDEAGNVIGPLQCVPLTGYTAVTAGGEFACALTGGGGVQCWGSGSGGRLGNGTEDIHTSPEDVCVPMIVKPPVLAGLTAGLDCLSLTGYVAVETGRLHACALHGGGSVACWGVNNSGRLGDGTKDTRLSPVSVCASGSGAGCAGGTPLGGMSQIAAGGSYSCAIAEAGDLRCWGTNFRGQMGMGPDVDQVENPVPIQGLTDVTLIQGGSRSLHLCAVEDDGSLRCWGNNANGELGIGTADMDPHPAPALVSPFGAKPTDTDTPEPLDTVEPTDTPAGSANTPTNTPPPGGLIGDVDCSGEVNAIDAAFVLQFVAGLVADLPCPENADANEDGEINTIDAALILQVSAGLLGMLPP